MNTLPLPLESPESQSTAFPYCGALSYPRLPAYLGDFLVIYKTMPPEVSLPLPARYGMLLTPHCLVLAKKSLTVTLAANLQFALYHRL